MQGTGTGSGTAACGWCCSIELAAESKLLAEEYSHIKADLNTLMHNASKAELDSKTLLLACYSVL